MERIKPGMIVENSEGKRGVTVPDFMSSCLYTKTPVVYEGTDYFLGTPTEELKIIGEENTVPDPIKCGAGKGPDCCVFLTLSKSGFCCERHTSLRYSIIFRMDKMEAQRVPTEMYPDCMNQGNK